MPAAIIENLTKNCQQFKTKLFINREQTIQQTLEILSRDITQYPILIGKSGVGRCTLVEQIALGLVDEMPELTVLRVNFANFTTTKLSELLKDLAQYPAKTVLFFVNLESFYQQQSVTSWQMLTNAIQQFINNEQFSIGFTATADFYYQVLQEQLLSSCHTHTIWLTEPSLDETQHLINDSLTNGEATKWLQFGADFIPQLINYAKQYLKEMALPGSALDLFNKVLLISGDTLDEIGESQIRMALQTYYQVNFEHALATTAETNLDQLIPALSQSIFGQHAVLELLGQRLPVYFLGLNHQLELPLFVFYGPEGVGKQTTAIKLANFLTGRSQAYEQVSMVTLTAEQLLDVLTKQAAKENSITIFTDFSEASTELLITLLEIARQGKFIDATGTTQQLVQHVFLFIWQVNQAASISSATTAQQIEEQQKTNESELIQLVVDDMPAAEEQIDDQLSLPENSLLTSELVKFPKAFVEQAEFIPFHQLSTSALIKLTDAYLQQLSEKLRQKQDISLVYNAVFPQALLETQSLQGATAEKLYKQLDNLVLSTVSKYMLIAPEKLTTIKLSFNTAGEIVCQ